MRWRLILTINLVAILILFGALMWFLDYTDYMDEFKPLPPIDHGPVE